MKCKCLTATVLLALLACSSNKEAAIKADSVQGLAQAKPEKDDAYRTLMAKSLTNYEYMSLGFMNFDTEKVKTAAGNMKVIGTYLANNIPPAYQSKSADWKAWCEELDKNATDIIQKTQANNPDELRASFQKVMQTCMECHMLYRKHLLSGSGGNV